MEVQLLDDHNMPEDLAIYIKMSITTRSMVIISNSMAEND